MYKLSIIIPIYNSEKYLLKCLNSILLKNNSDVEYILIDDGSTDGSFNIYNRYNCYSNVKIIKNSNHGVSYTRNIGIEKANGNFIMFIDSDDYVCDGWFKEVTKFLNEETDIIYFSKNFINNEYEKLELQKACLGFANNELKYCNIMSPCSKIYRRQFLLDNDILFNDKIINGEDMLFNFKALLLTRQIETVNYSYYYYQKNMFSSTNTFNSKIIDSDIEFHYELKRYIKNINSSEFENYYKLTLLKGIYLIFYRYSLSKNEDNSVFNFLTNSEYENELKKLNKYKSYFSNFEFLVLKLIAKKKYNLAIFILRIKIVIKKLFYKTQNNSISELI
jgi:glycosyltransferase involved in cell wall biosynthesis